MEGLFIVISIIIGVLNFAAEQKKKQNKEQGNVNRQQMQKSKPIMRQQKQIQQQPERTAMDMGIPWGLPSPSLLEINEGIEAEDRKQTGSLIFDSSEGTCDEHPEHRQKKSKVSKKAPNVEIVKQEEAPIFDLTEENLLRSVVMAEVLGPPRSMKRNIR